MRRATASWWGMPLSSSSTATECRKRFQASEFALGLPSAKENTAGMDPLCLLTSTGHPEPNLFRESMLNFYPGTKLHFSTHKIPFHISLIASHAVNSNGDTTLFLAGLFMLSWCWVPSWLQLPWLLLLHSLSPATSEGKEQVKLSNPLLYFSLPLGPGFPAPWMPVRFTCSIIAKGRNKTKLREMQYVS